MAGGAARGGAGLAIERRAGPGAQHERLARARRDGVLAVPVGGHRVAPFARAGGRAHVRGRGLGGSSVVNGMIAIHAMADDYDRWAAAGCPGWTYADVLPYRRRLESDLNFGDGPTTVPRADAGPATRSRRLGPCRRRARRERARRGTAGARTTTPRRHRRLAVRHQRSRRRASHDQRRLPRAGARPPEPQRARRRDGRPGLVEGRPRGGRARPRRRCVDRGPREEVVLCAGAIGSPAILPRSGIGPDGPAVGCPSASACRSTRWPSSGCSRARRRSRGSTIARPTAACATRRDWPTRARTT